MYFSQVKDWNLTVDFATAASQNGLSTFKVFNIWWPMPLFLIFYFTDL
jgi:hypothetical protein